MSNHEALAHATQTTARKIEYSERLYMEGLLELIARQQEPSALIPAYRGLARIYEADGRTLLSMHLQHEILQIASHKYGPQHPIVALHALEAGLLCHHAQEYRLARNLLCKGILALWKSLNELTSRYLFPETAATKDPHENLAADSAVYTDAGGALRELVELMLTELSSSEEAKCAIGSIGNGSAQHCIGALLGCFKHFMDCCARKRIRSFSAEEELELLAGLRRIEGRLRTRSCEEKAR